MVRLAPLERRIDAHLDSQLARLPGGPLARLGAVYHRATSLKEPYAIKVC
jgi:hypothetical protein